MDFKDLQNLRDTPPQPSAFTAGLAAGAIQCAQAHVAKVRNLTIAAATVVVAAAVTAFAIAVNNDRDMSEPPTPGISASVSAPDTNNPTSAPSQASPSSSSTVPSSPSDVSPSTSGPDTGTAPTSAPSAEWTQAPASTPPITRRSLR